MGNYDSTWNDHLLDWAPGAWNWIKETTFRDVSGKGSLATEGKDAPDEMTAQDIYENAKSNENTRAKDEHIYEHGKEGMRAADTNKPVEFNPPLHPTLRMSGIQAIPDKGVGRWNSKSKSGEHRGPPRNFQSGDTKLKFESAGGEAEARSAADWRLGQILPGDSELVDSSNSDVRYGFRFLYNPTSINFSTQVNNSIHSDPATINSQSVLFMKSGLGQITVQLLLNRIPDVAFGSLYGKPADVGGEGDHGLGRGDWSVYSRGTEFDLEYLFRTLNGVWNVRDVSKEKKAKGYLTGDMGMLLPTPVWISIGPTMKYYGRVVGMQHEHFMFSRDMVPVLTRVSLTFLRVFRGDPSDVDTINAGSAFGSYAGGDYFDIKDDDADGGSGGGDGNNISETSGVKIIKKPNKTSNRKYIWKTLLMNGYSAEQSAGIMGNLEHESQFDPKAVEQANTQEGRGLAQWGVNGRWPGVISLANSRDNYDKWSIEIQMEFMIKEMKDNWGTFNNKEFKEIGTIGNACLYFHNRYEVSNDTAVQIQGRVQSSEAIYSDLQDVPGYTITDGSTGSVGWPVQARFNQITRAFKEPSSFGYFCAGKNGMGGGHTAIDIAHPNIKGTPLFALKAGKILHRGSQNASQGFEMILVPDDGSNHWAYNHVTGSDRIPDGSKVEARQKIGTVGESGSSIAGAHLHLELFKKGHTWDCPNFLDPEPHLTKPGSGGGGGGSDGSDGGSGGGSWRRRTTGVTPSNTAVVTPGNGDVIDPADYIGDTPYDIPVESSHLYREVDGKKWVAPAASSLRLYPRNPAQAVRHGVGTILSGNIPPEPWVGRPMTAVARCYGLEDAQTAEISAQVLGPKTSPARQFRWLVQTHPGLAVHAPHSRSFGKYVPIGAILYWDEGAGGGFGSVGIALGYQNGLLQQLTTAPGSLAMVITDVVPDHCMGWTAPVFFAGSSFNAQGLLDPVKALVEGGA